MQSLRDLKKRIRSVKNIEQITKAMEVVSMNKMRRSQAFALSARPYAIASFELMHNLLEMSPELPELLKARPIERKLVVVVTADKGLAGAFNENVLRKASTRIIEGKNSSESISIIAIGKKAKDYFDRKKMLLDDSCVGLGDYTSLDETSPIALRIIDGFLKKKWDSVEFIYTHFRTTLKQETVLRTILPATEQSLREIIVGIVPEYGKFHELSEEAGAQRAMYNYEFVFEPSPKEILDSLVTNLLMVHVHHVILESNASEHSARMVSMKSASENAEELGTTLTLSYNKARQAGITAELSEIIAGQESMK